MTLERAAERASLSTNYLGSIERGNRDPSLSTIQRIAKALDTSAADLLGSRQSLSAEALEMGRLFDRLETQEQDALLRIVRPLARRKK